MQAPFPVITPGIFFHKALRIGKARDNVNEIDAPPLDIPLSFRFIPFKPHSVLYAQIVCTVKYFHRLYGYNRLMRDRGTGQAFCSLYGQHETVEAQFSYMASCIGKLRRALPFLYLPFPGALAA